MATYVFGEIPGNPVGTLYANRTAAMRAGVHQVQMPGIAGNRHVGCVSISVNGGYADDEDFGDRIFYTGEGGNDSTTKKQVADQSLDASGNSALLKSITTGLPVRVLRGPNGDWLGRPTSGFRYDGLFKVVDYWGKKGAEGFWIWQFHLERMPRQEALRFVRPVAAASGKAKPAGRLAPPRTTGTVQRTLRDTAVSRWVKELYDYTCQICCIRLYMKDTNYAEGAHIRALGAHDEGDDVVENMLCLCPNDHVLLDYGAIFITDGLEVLRHDGSKVSDLILNPKHGLDLANVQSHRARFGL